MENNFGGQNESKGQFQQTELNTDKQGHSAGRSLVEGRNQQLSNSFSHSEDVEDHVVAKTLNELDADILVAMENLSITDEDLLSSNSSNQNEDKEDENKGKT